MTGRLVPAALGAAILGVGAVALVAPGFAAASYGIPAEQPAARAFARAAGARDAALGMLVLGSLGERRALRAALAAATFVAVADAATLLAAAGPRPAHALHLAGALGCALAALRA